MNFDAENIEKCATIIDNIKHEPEAEFFCVLPAFDSERTLKGDLINTKEKIVKETQKKPELKCKICHKRCLYKQSLTAHEKMHQKQTCNICKRKIPARSFEKHLKTHANEKKERKFECKICFQKYGNKSNLAQHLRRHQKKFSCDFCEHLFASKPYLLRHLQIHISADGYKCLVCFKLFNTREVLRLHVREVHGNLKTRQRVTRNDLICGTCGKEFSTPGNRQVHEQSHKDKVECSICKQKFTEKTFQYHLRFLEGKLIKCSLCPKRFPAKSCLKAHERTHIKFECDFCGDKFKHKIDLEIHISSHFDPNTFKCEFCGRKFANNRSLRLHLASKSCRVVKPTEFRCEICQKTLLNFQNFKRHKKVHENRVTCEICSKSCSVLSYPYHFKVHKIRMHEKKMQCKVCVKKFFTKQDLRKHMKVHAKAFKCDLCGHRTAHKNQVKLHIIAHINGSPECLLCYRRFSTKFELKIHEMTHKKLK